MRKIHQAHWHAHQEYGLSSWASGMFGNGADAVAPPLGCLGNAGSLTWGKLRDPQALLWNRFAV